MCIGSEGDRYVRGVFFFQSKKLDQLRDRLAEEPWTFISATFGPIRVNFNKFHLRADGKLRCILQGQCVMQSQWCFF